MSATGGAPNNNRSMRKRKEEDDNISKSSQQRTPLFEQLVTKEVRELKAYSRIIENQNRRLAELERVHSDLEARLELECKGREQLEETLERREREWSDKLKQLERDRDHWKDVVQEEKTRNSRLMDQVVVTEDQDILPIRNLRSSNTERGETNASSPTRSSDLAMEQQHKSPHEILEASYLYDYSCSSEYDDNEIHIRELSLSDAMVVNDNWDYKSSTSLKMVQEMIQSKDGCCLGAFTQQQQQQESSSPPILCGWILQYQDGPIGILFCKEEWRNKGIAQALVSRAMNKILSNSNDKKQRKPQPLNKDKLLAYIVNGNTKSENLFMKKIGWKQDRSAYWLGFTSSSLSSSLLFMLLLIFLMLHLSRIIFKNESLLFGCPQQVRNSLSHYWFVLGRVLDTTK